MKVEYFKEYSFNLNREMEFKVFGHAGRPVLVFPAQDGRFYDFENFKMVESVTHLIDAGRLQLFCCDSIDPESWSSQHWDKRARISRHEAWFHYICDELAPRIYDVNAAGNGGYYAKGLLTTGCSMGATHALNFFLRRPDIFDGVLALSGVYRADFFFGDYCDELVYNNDATRYLPQMDPSHYYIDMYNQRDMILTVGQGRWEEPCIEDAHTMKQLFESKGIHAWVDFWGHDVDHDWPWWRVQFPYYMEKLC